MKRYASSLDATAKAVPWFIIALSVVIALSLYFGIRSQEQDTTSSNLVLTISIVIQLILLPGIVIAMYLLKTTGIVVDYNTITIDRKISPVVINFTDIRLVRKVDDMKFAIRTGGNGGVFGYTGYYYKKGIGTMRWYCTQRCNYVLIEKTNGKKLVITPDDPDGFISDVEAINPSVISEGNASQAT